MVLHFDPALFDPLLYDTGDELNGPPIDPGTSPMVLMLFQDEVGAIEWDTTTEEVLGGVGRARITLQDRVNGWWAPFIGLEVKVIIRATGWVLFHGEIMSISLALPPGFPFRRWTLDCRDFNSALDERLIAPDQFGLQQMVPDEPFIPVTPIFGINSPSKVNIQTLIDDYLRLPVGVIDDDTYVEDFTPAINTGDSAFDITAMTNLRSALETLAALADVNVQDWLDPDDAFHHQAIPIAAELVNDGSAGDNLPAAPSIIGPGGAGIMALTVTLDGQAMVQEVYVQGGTGATADAVTSARTPGGSGWYPSDTPSRSTRQAYVSASGAWSDDLKRTFAEAALRRGLYPTVRGSVTIQGVDGWRAGQVVTINDDRLPMSLQGSHKFVIQRVATSLYAGTDVRQYVLDFGDGSINALASSGQVPSQSDVTGEKAKPPALIWTADWADFGAMAANEVRKVVFTPRNGKGDPWGPPGVPVTFVVEVRDSDGNLVTGVGSCIPDTTVTDKDGKARTELHAGVDDGLYYQVFLETPMAPAP